MKNKITTKKIKSVAKGASKKTGLFIKKAGKKAGKMAENLKREWKKEQPQREELMKAANKTLEQGIKIGGDVFETIRKDLNEMNNQKKGKNK